MSETRIEGFPLSPQQRDLWLLQESGGAGVYRCQGLVRIGGPLEADRLRSALAWTIERNEILRTVFPSLAEVRTPLQAVLEPTAPDLPVLDLEGPAPDAGEEKIAALWDELLAAPVDFERGPLFRTALMRLSKDEHLLLLSLPSLCADAAGLDNLVAEIRACYAALATPGEEPDEPLQYVDLAEWQNGILAAEDSQEGVEIWRRRLLAMPAATLPFQRGERAAELSPRNLPVATPEGVDADLLLTAWLVLLRRLSGQAGLGVGVACDGRNYAELTSAPGLFARFLPVTTLAGDSIPFSALRREAAASLAEARQWQQCFSWDLLAEPGAAGRPWFPFCFEAEEPAAGAEPTAGVAFSLARRSACIDRFHLKLLWRAAQGRAEIHYDPAHFETGDVERLADQLAALAESALATPGMPARDLDMLSAAERRELLVRFNDNPPLAPADAGTVYELFTRWAERTPDAEAVVCEGERLTYRELARRARHLAGTLQRLGVGPEVPVGLLVDRSVEMVVGLLGILGSGGAYVPLDPALPAERLAFLLADSRPALLVTGGQPLRGLPEPLPPVIPVLAEGTEERPASGTRGENLAYVIYTSGSTGRPKGVAIEHRQLLNYVLGILERAPLPPGSRFATVSTLAADLGNTSLFGALCGGGTLHVIAAERASHPEALGQYFSRHGIDSVKIVPSHLRALLQGNAPERVLPRRQLILGGEPCAWDLVARVRALAPGCRVINHYGPTETTVGVLTHAVESERPAGAAVLPLDRPLAGSRIYLLDGFRPVPRWTAGEVHIAGAGLARGYLNRPDLTAERFIPDPVSGEPGSRLYRTGDLARHLSGGGLEILGRMDDQVKIRGFRIEPGEIEAALREHPTVLAAAVIARGEGDDKRLVAYVVPRPEAEPAAGDLRRHLAVRLPEAMIPADFVQLAVLPLTANGKLDRQALPAPEEAPAAFGALSAPRTPAEELLAGIWCEVLKREAVGVHDDFFELGGHSLLVAQIVSRIRDCFGVEIALRDLFEEPTVAGLAGRVEAAGLAAGRPEAPPLERAARDGSLPLSFSQRRLWFFDQFEPGSAFYNIFVPVLLSGPLDAVALAGALTVIVGRHEMLRTTFANAGGEPVQVPGPERPQDLPVADLSGLDGAARDAEAERLAAEEARLPFDLECGPLLRTRLVRLGEDRHLALLSMHHIASDAWSMGILVREIVALYEAAIEGRPSPLPELPIQYADFARWQTRWLSGDHLESELAYWRRQLAGAPAALDLPTDRPRPPVLTFRGGRESLLLPAILCEGLRRLSRRRGATLFMTFLAAFAVQLRHASGRADVVVGTNVANRDRLETEGLIGFFVNQLVLRTDLSGDPEFAEILSRVRATALGAYEHQHVPFERLVEELQPPRDRSRSLLYQHKIEYADGERDAFELPSLRVEPYSFANPPARYDLHLTLSNAGRDIRAALLYNADLFAAPTAVRFLEDFRNLLETVSVDPHLRLGKLEEGLASLDRQRRAADEEEYAGAVRQKLKSVRRLAVSG